MVKSGANPSAADHQITSEQAYVDIGDCRPELNRWCRRLRPSVPAT